MFIMNIFSEEFQDFVEGRKEETISVIEKHMEWRKLIQEYDFFVEKISDTLSEEGKELLDGLLSNADQKAVVEECIAYKLRTC